MATYLSFSFTGSGKAWNLILFSVLGSTTLAPFVQFITQQWTRFDDDADIVDNNNNVDILFTSVLEIILNTHTHFSMMS